MILGIRQFLKISGHPMENNNKAVDKPLGLNGFGKTTSTSHKNSNSVNGATSVTHQAITVVPSSSNNCDSHSRSTDTDSEVEPEDEYCVYTYKGDSRAAADLPSSFYKFDSSDGNGTIHKSGQSSSSTDSNVERDLGYHRVPNRINAPESFPTRRCLDYVDPDPVHNIGKILGRMAGARAVAHNNQNVFSPDMDFLEMDFDPGGTGDEDDSANPEPEPSYENGMELLERERNLFTKQIKTAQSTKGGCRPLLESRTAANSNSNVRSSGSGNCEGTTGIAKIAIDVTNGSSSYSNASTTNCSPTTISRQSKSPNRVVKSTTILEAPMLNESQPQSHCSKTLKIGDTRRSSGSGSGKVDFASICNSCNNNNKYMKTRLQEVKDILKSNARSPTNQFSLRLVKSNTLPEIGRHLRRDSDPEIPSTSTATSPFPSVGASGMSFSVPVIKVEPHFRAIINTNTSSSNSSKSPEDYSVELEVESVMIWTIEDAYERSINQIGVSACGATAVCNVLGALGYEKVNHDLVNQYVGTRVRAELGDLPEYLFSRSGAGATHLDLLSGIRKVSENIVNGRFFQPRPEISSESFSKWLLHWICKGAVPVLTRNLQVTAGSASSDLPDSWHHQMVFGVSPGVLFLTNPIECVEVNNLLPQLTSSSVLLVRRNDIICRRTPKTDIRLLARHPDPRWNQMNVLGQVANIILEDMPTVIAEARRVFTSHIRIPADYRGGVTLFMHETSPAYSLLMNAPDL